MDRGFEGEISNGPKTLDLDKVLKHGPLPRPSFYHGRNIPLTHAQAAELIDHPKKDVYYSLKGGSFDKTPFVQVSPHEARGFRIEGLVPEGETAKAKQKQKYLIDHGLPTETFLEIYPLMEVPDPNSPEEPNSKAQKRGGRFMRFIDKKNTVEKKKTIPIDEWRKLVIEQLEFRKTHSYREYDDRYGANGLVTWGDDTTNIDKAIEYVKSKNFVVVLREQPLPDSLIDIQEAESVKDAEKILDRTFRYINNEERFKDDPLVPRGGFNTYNAKRIQQYFFKFLPARMADYLSKLHDLGLSHGFAHGQNWKLGAFLNDLDSMKGEQFGNPAPTDKERLDDVQRSIEAIDTIFNIQALGGFSKPTRESYISRKFIKDTAMMDDLDKLFVFRKEAICQLLAHYFKLQNLKTTTSIPSAGFLNPVREFVEQFDIKEKTYNNRPPVTKLSYAAHIVQILSQEFQSQLK